MEVQIEGPSLAHLTQDLRAVGTRLQRMVLVDNDAEVFFFQPDNGISVEDYLVVSVRMRNSHASRTSWRSCCLSRMSAES